MDTWKSQDPDGIDAAAIEHMDRRSLEILREDEADRRYQVRFPSSTELALLVQLELPPRTTASDAFDQIQSSAIDGPFARFSRLLNKHGLLDDTELALPGDRHRAEQLIAVREAVPAGVNRRVGRAQREIDSRIAKTAADMIVPFDRFGEMMQIYRDGFLARGLDFAVWGHISDGNVHPNVLPRSTWTSNAGERRFWNSVATWKARRLPAGGAWRRAKSGQTSPAARLYGDEGIAEMRAVKRALDRWKFAPGVIFPR